MDHHELTPAAGRGDLPGPLDPGTGPARAVLLDRLGHDFNDPDLFDQALRHRSWAHLTAQESNERLEFLGDAIIGLYTTLLLTRLLPAACEGELSGLRSRLVSAEELAPVAARLGVGDAVSLDHGEQRSGGREKRSVLCDTFEAIIGAVCLDAGVEAAGTLVQRHLAGTATALADGGTQHWRDPKSRLQELAQRGGGPPPEYRFSVEGPDHAPRHTADVLIDGVVIGSGEGSDKKQAAAQAASVALEVFDAGAHKGEKTGGEPPV